MPHQFTCSHCGTPVDVKPHRARPDGIHYHGACYSAMRRVRSEQTLFARTWDKVDRNGPLPVHRPELGPCWIWIGARDQNGYGHTSLNGVVLQSHRVTWENANGPIPVGLEIDHLCRTHSCVRPDHLEPVTTRVNLLRGEHPSMVVHRTNVCRRGHQLTADSTVMDSGSRRCKQCRLLTSRRRYAVNPPPRRGRAIGERHPQSRLTGDMVREIRAAASLGEETNRAIAARYGVSPALIGHIVKRKAWKHID